MNIEHSQNIVTGDVNAAGNVIVGNGNIIVNLKEAAQYKDLQNKLEDLKGRFNKALANSIKYPDDEGFKEEMYTVSTEQNKIIEQIEALKKAVIKLAEDFSGISVNSERLKIAKAYFENGEFDKARAVLDAETMTNELNALKEEQEQLKGKLALNQQSLKEKSNEFLILARLTSIDFTKTDRVETTRNYFEKSVSANAGTENILAYIYFLKENNQFIKAYDVLPQLEILLQQEETKNNRAYTINTIDFWNLKGFLLEQQDKYADAIGSYKEALTLYRNTSAKMDAGSKILLMKILNNIASLLFKVKEYDLALEFTEECVQEYKAVLNPGMELKAEYGRALQIAATVNAKIWKIYQTGNSLKSRLDASNCNIESIAQFKESISIFREICDKHPEKYLAAYVACLVDEAKWIREQSDMNKEGAADIEKTYAKAVEVCETHSRNNPELFFPVLATVKVLFAGFLKRCYNAVKELKKNPEFSKEIGDVIDNMAKYMVDFGKGAYEIAEILYENQGRPYLPILAACQRNLGFAYLSLNNQHTALDYLLSAQKSYDTLTSDTPYIYLEESIKTTEAIGYLYLEQKNIERAENAFLKLDNDLLVLIANKHLEYFNDMVSNLYILSNVFKNNFPNREKSLHYANEVLQQIEVFEGVAGERFIQTKQKINEIISYWQKERGFFAKLKQAFS